MIFLRQFFLPFALSLPLIAQSTSLDLSGVWALQLDPEDKWFEPVSAADYDHEITLPGTTSLDKVGEHQTKALPHQYYLTQEWRFVGPAWYQREIEIPADWQGKEVELFLERVMWQSRVWVDGKEAGPALDSLCTPHLHLLGKLSPGKHVLTLRIDNRMIWPIGDKNHAYGDQTQGIWNGVTGQIKLRARVEDSIELARVFPRSDGKVRVELKGNFSQGNQVTLSCSTPEQLLTGRFSPFVLDQAVEGKKASLEGQAVTNPALWSEFSPSLHALRIELKDGSGKLLESRDIRFGFRDLKSEGNQLLINKAPTFLRGNLECAVFPKLGHPPTDVESWRKIWTIYQEYNLNHARFHSWCPPEAAFIAADEMGIYLQVEGPVWIDHWMSGPNGRPEMDTPGYPKGVGLGDRGIDEFFQAEINRILDSYGNHPSFIMFCIGNELGNSNFTAMGQWMVEAKEYDPRHLYSASTARQITQADDYMVTHNLPGVGATRQHMYFGTNWDYEAVYGGASLPVLTHEVGQWPAYPNFASELSKYTGPLRPYRLEDMYKQARENGIDDARIARYHAASGGINQLLYRYEIESFLRTASCRGFQLLGMQDFSGQGEALVGWLDSFYDSKGVTNPGTFRQYCAPVAPLLELPAFCFHRSETPEIRALLRNDGPVDLKGVKPTISVEIKGKAAVQPQSLEVVNVARGVLRDLGGLELKLPAVTQATAAEVVLDVPGVGSNRYAIWIYPDEINVTAPDEVLFTASLPDALEALAAGKKVLLQADLLGPDSSKNHAAWRPLYWSMPFFPGQERDTLGLSVDAESPAFAHFPTDSYGNWNWHRICRGAHGFDVTDVLPADYRPLVEPVCDFHINRRYASLFELSVGCGKLLVCGYNVSDQAAQNMPEVAQLRASLLAYAASAEFAPKTSLSAEDISTLLAPPASPKRRGVPERFAQADLYVSAAALLPQTGRGVPWKACQDNVGREAKGVTYQVYCEGSRRDEQGHAWFGRNIKVSITPRSGVPGKLYVRFADWNQNGRLGSVTVEGNTVEIGSHVDGKWLEFAIIREDSNDGQIVLEAKASSGPNLILTDLAFVPEEQ